MVTRIGTAGRDILRGTAAADHLSGLGGNDDLFGQAGNDTLIGGTGNDKLFGRAGDDELLGGAGNDILFPGYGGNDAVDGGPGFDFVSYADTVNAQGVTVDLTTGRGQAGGPGGTNQFYWGIEGVIGSPKSDLIILAAGNVAFGGATADVFVSTAGATMRGDGGSDVLNGDTGTNFTDVFWLQKLPGINSLGYFNPGQDKIKIKASDFGIGAALNPNELVNDSSGHDSVVGTRPQFIYDITAHELWFDTNGIGTGGAIHICNFFNGNPAQLDPILFIVV